MLIVYNKDNLKKLIFCHLFEVDLESKQFKSYIVLWLLQLILDYDQRRICISVSVKSNAF